MAGNSGSTILSELERELSTARSSRWFNEMTPAERLAPTVIEYRGRKLTDFTGWDILGLAQNASLKRKVAAHLSEEGFGSSASRLGAGTRLTHLRAEQRFASFYGEAAGITVSSRNQAVLSIISALAKEQDLVLFDESSDCPFLEACELAGASAHAIDVDAVNWGSELQKHHASYRRIFICIEETSGSLGSVRNLSHILAEAERHEVNVILDSTFALGISGARGAGVEDTLHSKALLCRFFSLAHALQGFGAIAVGPTSLIELIVANSRTLANEPAISTALSLWATEALDVAELAGLARKKSLENAKTLSAGLAEIGLPAPFSGSPILVVAGVRLENAVEIREGLIEQGYLVDIIRPFKSGAASVSIRLLCSAEHTHTHISGLKSAIAEVRSRLKSV